MCEITWRQKSAKLAFHHVATFWDSSTLRSYSAEYRRCNDSSRRFNHTFWDTPTLRSYGIKLLLRCCLYWPNRSGWRQKVIMPLRTFMLLSWWCPLGQSKGHLPAREDIIMDRLIPILTHLSSHWTVPLTTVVCGQYGLLFSPGCRRRVQE